MHKGLPTQKTPRTTGGNNEPHNILEGAKLDDRCINTQQAEREQAHECLSEESKDHCKNLQNINQTEFYLFNSRLILE